MVENSCQELILLSSVSRGQNKARTIGKIGLTRRVDRLEAIFLGNCLVRISGDPTVVEKAQV